MNENEKNGKLYEIFKQQLEDTDYEVHYWETMIKFIEDQMKKYFKALNEKGIDPSLIAPISTDEKIKDKLDQIKKLLISLSKLNFVIDEAKDKNKQRIEILEEKIDKKDKDLKEINQKLLEFQKIVDEKNNELELNKSNFITYKRDIDHKLEIQPKKLKSDLIKELKLVRDRINMINEMVLQTQEDNVEKMQSRVYDAVQTIVKKLSDEDLWPENDRKPEGKPAKTDRVKPKRGRNNNKNLVLEDKTEIVAVEEKPVENKRNQNQTDECKGSNQQIQLIKKIDTQKVNADDLKNTNSDGNNELLIVEHMDSQDDNKEHSKNEEIESSKKNNIDDEKKE